MPRKARAYKRHKVDPDPRYNQEPQRPTLNQGPESFWPERLKIGYTGRRHHEEPLDSGFGPFSLTRLAVSTGGLVSDDVVLHMLQEELKKPRTFNMIIMGAMVKSIPGIDKDKCLKAINKTFKSKYEKDPKLEALNIKAFELGYDLA